MEDVLQVSKLAIFSRGRSTYHVCVFLGGVGGGGEVMFCRVVCYCWCVVLLSPVVLCKAA